MSETRPDPLGEHLPAIRTLYAEALNAPRTADGVEGVRERAEAMESHLRAITRYVALPEHRIMIPRPVVAFGPVGVPEPEATAHYLNEAATRIENGRYFGSNLTRAVTLILRDCADAVAASMPVANRPRRRA